MTFKELGLREELIRAVEELGFESPTPIQEQAISVLMKEETDLVGLAQTGTGKTAAFSLPMLHQIDLSLNQVQGIIVCPTRELANQITDDIRKFSPHLKKFKVTSVYGGVSIDNQISAIKKGAQVIVATPGRLVDLINRKKVNLSNVRIAVLDEADEMLNMGFKEDLDIILEQTPEFKQTWLFSATMPNEVARIAKNYMIDPTEVSVAKNISAENIHHEYYMVKERDRYFALKRLIDFYPNIFGLIFCRTKKQTQDIAENLIKDGYSCDSLHGDLSQAQRDRVMDKFRSKSIQLLCATDVAARGIDVNDITHVINYILPDEIENYTHRSGRTARAGKSGVSIAIINTREQNKIKGIERIIKKDFEFKKIPTGKAICEKQLFSIVDKMLKVEVDVEQISEYLPKVLATFEGFTKEELVERFVATEFNHFLQYYKGSGDLNAEPGRSSRNERGGRGDRDDRGGGRDGNFNRYFISVGKQDGLEVGGLINFICRNSNIEGSRLGRVDLKREFSFFEVEADIAEQMVKKLQKAKFDGRDIRVEPSGKSKSFGGKSKSKGKGWGKKDSSGGSGGRAKKHKRKRKDALKKK